MLTSFWHGVKIRSSRTAESENRGGNTMTRYGYGRVSTKDQNLDRQIRALEKEGAEIIYSEKVSGAKERPELEKLLNKLCEGDVLIVSELTRVSRSTQDLINIVNRVMEAGATIKSVKDKWLDTSSAQGKLMLTIFAGLAEFERDLLIERVKDGMETAKQKGVALGRPKANVNKLNHAIDLYLAGDHNVPQILDICGVSKSTLYRELRERGIKRGVVK